MSDESQPKQDIYLDLGRLARSLQSQQASDLDSDRLLRGVTELATQILPGVAHGGVALVVNRRRRALESVAATGAVARAIDRLQDEHQQGPCLESLWNQYTVRVDDYDQETRWPDFVADLVEQTPVRSSLSIQLYTNENELGTLNLYSEEAGTFTPEIEELAVALAAQAAVGLAAARSSDDLRSALASRDIIGQAKGIIMESYKVTSGEAFILLTKLSQNSNTPLYEIARKLVFADRPPT
ncbi:transcriptional regulator [Mycobacterium sp. MFM001]|uniref:GAF and ANTAR domain-containing protein n=1 Tax=Mycobacterium sp. MFM001 TaxID=2049453 RepID=UPI000DA47AE3|nr:GAF and ANTAR domain-containing protein [Mycobacterium sp. MFM001]GBE66466.1 transcriptional regulator [Mycobacterium sp. MFM001]